MTFEEIVNEGRARALDFGVDWPSTNRVLYRRIQVREQELFSAANMVNPDYFGVNVIGVLDSNGDVNLKDLDVEGSAIDPTSMVTRVEIQDPGTSMTLARKDKVSVIPHNDPDADVAPRMTLRNFILSSFCDDLDGVVSVCIYYGYRPAPKATPIADDEESELPSVYQELLVLDICRFLLRMTIQLDADVKAAHMAALMEEVSAMQATFLSEVSGYASLQSSRFDAPVGAQRE